MARQPSKLYEEFDGWFISWIEKTYRNAMFVGVDIEKSLGECSEKVQ